MNDTILQVEDGCYEVITQIIALKIQLMKAEKNKVHTYGQVDISNDAVRVNNLKEKIKNLQNFVKKVRGST